MHKIITKVAYINIDVRRLLIEHESHELSTDSMAIRRAHTCYRQSNQKPSQCFWIFTPTEVNNADARDEERPAGQNVQSMSLSRCDGAQVCLLGLSVSDAIMTMITTTMRYDRRQNSDVKLSMRHRQRVNCGRTAAVAIAAAAADL